MGSALPAIDALPSCDAISKAPRAAGYRGSDFVHWVKAGLGSNPVEKEQVPPNLTDSRSAEFVRRVP